MTSRDRPLIAHIIYRLHVGGLENGLVNLLNHEKLADIEHAIVCVEASGSFAGRLWREDIRIVEIGKRPGIDLRSYGRIWAVLRQLKPDVVHTRNANTVEYQILAKFAGIRRGIHGEHGWDTHDLYGQSAKYKWLRRAASVFIWRFIVVSSHLEQYLRDVVGVPRRKVELILNGVDTRRFSITRHAAGDWPWTATADSERPVVIGTVGRLYEVKNQVLLIEAVKRLVEWDSARAARLRLVIAGDGPMKSGLELAIREGGLEQQAWLAGHSDRIDELLQGFDIFVLPSKNEGISNTLLEAMACGKAVVATDVGGNSEVVRDGETGTLVPPGDADSMARAIRDYADDPARRHAHGAAGRERVVANFSLDNMAGRYREVYRAAVDG